MVRLSVAILYLLLHTTVESASLQQRWLQWFRQNDNEPTNAMRQTEVGDTNVSESPQYIGVVPKSNSRRIMNLKRRSIADVDPDNTLLVKEKCVKGVKATEDPVDDVSKGMGKSDPDPVSTDQGSNGMDSQGSSSGKNNDEPILVEQGGSMGMKGKDSPVGGDSSVGGSSNGKGMMGGTNVNHDVNEDIIFKNDDDSSNGKGGSMGMMSGSSGVTSDVNEDDDSGNGKGGSMGMMSAAVLPVMSKRTTTAVVETEVAWE